MSSWRKPGSPEFASDSPTVRNIELKARLTDRPRAEATCAELNATYQGDIHQIDTYFNVPEGRLKLREKDPGNDELIHYRRDNHPETRASDYTIVPAPPGLKVLLTDALSVLATVEKTRSLWLYENVRIHLDRVQSLGDFIEFEAVLDDTHNDADGHAKIAQLRQAFNLTAEHLIDSSYLDLTLSAGR